MSDRTNKLTVFYSWQSTLPRETNNDAIRQAIRTVVSELEEIYTDTIFELDEANRNTSGSNDIAADILKKIPQADIFISDISLINTNSSGEEKQTPNPNVLIELGFAAATIGWNRTIMVFNKNYGEINNVPFDIKGRTILDYKVKNGTDASGKGQLRVELKAAIKNIIDESPLRPHELSALTPEEKKRKRDIDNLKWILSQISIPFFDSFIERMPLQLDTRIDHYWQGYKAVLHHSLFHIYDPHAIKLLNKLYTYWRNTLSRTNQYRESQNSDIYIFGTPNYRTEGEQKDFIYLSKQTDKLEKVFKELLVYIKEHYLEIDINETSKAAFEDFKYYEAKFQ